MTTVPMAVAFAAASAAANAQSPAEMPLQQALAAGPVCTDRPSKSNSVCTVPSGQVQIETDILNWTRANDRGAHADILVPVNPVLKFGLGANTDLQASWAPYVRVRTRTGGAAHETKGVGDVVLRLKQRVTDASAKLQLGIIPFIKVPTAKRGIGNRQWEGGVALPIQYSLPKGFTVTLGPELDLLADSNDPADRHIQLVGAVNVGKALSSRVTVYAELWTAQNHDPAGTVRQYSADLAIAYLVSTALQLDAGGNFGLNRATPDAQLYFGLSTRF